LLNLCASLGQQRQGLLALHFEIPRIQARDHLAYSDQLVLIYEHVIDRPGYAGTDLVDVRRDVCVIGFNPDPGIFPPTIGRPGGGGCDSSAQQRQNQAVGRPPCDAWFLVRLCRISGGFSEPLQPDFEARAWGFLLDSGLRTYGFVRGGSGGYRCLPLIHRVPVNDSAWLSPNTLFLGPAISTRYGWFMELRHLRYFVAVAEELNLTHAAARLRVAQPALSRQMKDLEDELQIPLFDRGRTGVQLTRAGRVFYQRARSILAQATEAANEARSAGGAMTGSLVLGFASGLHLSYLAPVIKGFRKSHPQLQFDYFHGLTGEQLKALRESRIDVAFVYLPARLDGLEYRVIWRLPFKVVLPERHPLARRPTLELADLRSEDFVFCTRESRPEAYDEFFRHCVNTGFRPHVVKEVGGYPTNMLGLISVGLGVSVLPHFEKIERISGIVWRPLSKPALWWDWALVWRRQGASRVVEQFVATAEKHFPIPPEANRAEF
jgi:DNA-binding transcriptional LysR family regulator